MFGLINFDPEFFVGGGRGNIPIFNKYVIIVAIMFVGVFSYMCNLGFFHDSRCFLPHLDECNVMFSTS